MEYRFPAGPHFKTYAHKTSDQHAEANHRVDDAALAEQLRDAAVRVFNAFGGVGYARLDFRVDANGTLELPRASKLDLARQLVAEIARRLPA